MKLQILTPALLFLSTLPAQHAAPDFAKACRAVLEDVIAKDKIDKPIRILTQAEAKDLAPLAAWTQRAKDLLLAFPDEEETGGDAGGETGGDAGGETGGETGGKMGRGGKPSEARLGSALLSALVAKKSDGPEAKAYIAMGQPAFVWLQDFRKRFEMAKREWILACIGKARDGGSVYEGQFRALSALGKDGLKLALAMLDEKSPLFSPGNEAWLLRATRDLGVSPKKRQLKRLVALEDDLMLDQEIRYLAMLCLADFGDKQRFEAKEAEFRKLSSAAQEWNQRDGLGRLGRLYSDARQHEKAVEAFTKSLVLRKAEKDESLAGLRYNLSCSLAKLGRLDEAFAVFDKGLAGGKAIPDRLLASDKDLDPLRKDPRFDKLMQKYKRLGYAKPVERPVKKDREAEKDGDKEGGKDHDKDGDKGDGKGGD